MLDDKKPGLDRKCVGLSFSGIVDRVCSLFLMNIKTC